MKKLLAIIALVVLGATSTYAQLGLRAGINFNNIGKDAKDDPFLKAENKTGFHIGAVYNIDLIGGFAIEPGLYFTQKGFSLDGETMTVPGASMFDFSAKGDANMNYLEVPVNVKYKLLDLAVLGLDAHIGPFLAYGLGGKCKDSKVFDNGDGDMNCKRFDFGLQMGIGAQIAKKVYAGVNYDMSLTKVDAELPASKDNLKETNHVWMISVGFNF
ncbi:MAG: PorT family protein [Bacteroidales bacterium]|nr:PorT family protein [Bacteroidales bacterium]